MKIYLDDEEMKIYLDDEVESGHVRHWPTGTILIFRYSGGGGLFVGRADGKRWEYTQDFWEMLDAATGEFRVIAVFVPEKTDR